MYETIYTVRSKVGKINYSNWSGHSPKTYRTIGSKMNKRIEKLGEQADLLGEFTPTKIPGRYVGYITEEQILKFAELIVRECMIITDELVVNSTQTSIELYADYNDALFEVKKRIKEHFGVEQ